MNPSSTKRLVITGCVSVYQGANDRGEYEIFEVTATTPDGGAVTLPLRAFSELPLGEGEFDVTPYTDKKGNTSYTLKPPRGARSSSGVSRADFAALVARVDQLERAAVSPSASGRSADDDEIPF